MSKNEIISAFSSCFEAGEIDKMANLMADNFVIEDFFEQPIPKASFVAYLHALKLSFPDMRLNLHIIGEEGQCVRATFRFMGTHTGNLDLSSLGIPMVPATGRTVALPLQLVEHLFVGDKIAKMRIPAASGGDFPSLLQQLGVEFPGF